MSTAGIVLLCVAAVLLVLVIAVIVTSTRRRRLKQQFGDEYARTIDVTGSKRDAERELAARAERHDQLNIRPLSQDARMRLMEQWEATQARFVDEPPVALAQADRLVQEAMQARGYPTGEFDQQTADLSVEHAGVIDNFRKAHDITLDSERGRATTERLRMAMVHYRSVFEALLRDTDDDDVPAAHERHESGRTT